MLKKFLNNQKSNKLSKEEMKAIIGGREEGSVCHSALPGYVCDPDKPFESCNYSDECCVRSSVDPTIGYCGCRITAICG